MNNETYILTKEEIKELVSEAISTISSTNEIIDENELSKRLKLSKVTLHKYRKEGIIPFLQYGRSIRYNYPLVINVIGNKE